mmetsp:Transcript_119884/g.188043  ORF Transcript_119884/g.188043 Transcript_119884/m.188043 type:complete len:229 (+) Transcript_119884:112-798(+)
MCQPQIFTGIGLQGLKTHMIAAQFDIIPNTKPVLGRKIARPVGLKWLKAISCKRPHRNPMNAPQCSINRNSCLPRVRKKVLRSSLFSVNTFTIIPALSMPMFGSHSNSVNFVHSSGDVSWILSTALFAIFSCTLAGSMPEAVGKCLLPTFSKLFLIISCNCGRILSTKSGAWTRLSHTRGPSICGLAYLYESSAIFLAFRGTMPCQPIPSPLSRYCHSPRKESGRNII